MLSALAVQRRQVCAPPCASCILIWGASVPELLSALLQVADPNRIHYGSDRPFTPIQICEELLSALNNAPLLDEPLRSKVMSGNARHLLPRLSQG
jgi:6-methylsalicylate decarboxylase